MLGILVLFSCSVEDKAGYTFEGSGGISAGGSSTLGDSGGTPHSGGMSGSTSVSGGREGDSSAGGSAGSGANAGSSNEGGADAGGQNEGGATYGGATSGGATDGGVNASGGSSPGAGGDAARGGRAESGGAGATGSGGTPATTGGVTGNGGMKGDAGTGGAVGCTKVDCTDPACVNDVCVNGASSNWTGPIALYEGPDSNVPACAAPFSSQVFTARNNVVQTPATCSTCSCTVLGRSCSTNVKTFASANCTGSVTSNSLVVVNQNNNVPNSSCSAFPSGTQSAIADAAYAVTVCGAPSAQNPTKPPISWSKAARGCALPFPSSKGCGAAEVCAQVPTAPFNGKLCVYQAGDIACPPAQYTVKRVYYQGADDGRTCTNCGCAQDTPPNCSIITQVHGNLTCGFAVLDIGAPSSCQSGAIGSVLPNIASTQLTGGTCKGTGGQPSGTITPSQPITICCTP